MLWYILLKGEKKLSSLPMKVLLVNPNQMRPPVTPIGLDYVASSLELEGFEVDLLDLCFAPSWEEGVDAYFEDNDPLAIGISVRNTDDCYYLSQDFIIPKVKAIIDSIKKKTSHPLILGGVGFSVMPEQIMAFLGVELGIWGDGERALPALVKKIKKGEDFFRIPGLVYRKDGKYRRNPPKLFDLARLPVTRREAVDNPRYFSEGGMGSIETKRGCEQQCIYCADPLAKGRRYRLRPPHTVVDEIEILLGKGVDHLHLCDSEFNLPYDHAIEVCKEIIRRDLGEKLSWYAYLSPVPFTEELARLMSKAGCKGIDFGVDHGDDRMLKNLGRPFTSADLRKTASICRRQGMPFMYDLLLGGPGEDRESVTKTISLMKEINPSRVGISAGVRIYTGTRLAEIVLAEGVHEKNPNLRGVRRKDFFLPIFYLSQNVGDEMIPYIASLVRGDERFFFGGGEDVEANYNYNDNSVLMEAIKRGYRGAYWDILRRLADEAKDG
jgi:radical SAM superfamily enzyme YgiQ (UPF0313 family)